jgi:hypothetical protein
VGHSVCKLAGLQARNDYQNPNRVVLHGKTACVGLHPQLLDRLTPFFFCELTIVCYKDSTTRSHVVWNGGWPALKILW